MKRQTKYSMIITGLVLYCGLPLLLYALGDLPRRDVLKESLSLLFLLMFSLMLGLFFLSRSNRPLLRDIHMHRTVSIHKLIGYTAVAIFLLHPFLLVIPRYFEASVDPVEAFLEILASFDNVGVLLGLIAYVLMLLLGIISLLRKRLPYKYTSWRLIHGLLAMVFVGAAVWHVLLLGRHVDLGFTLYFLVLAISSMLVINTTILLNPGKE